MSEWMATSDLFVGLWTTGALYRWVRWRMAEWLGCAQGPDMPLQPRVESALQLYGLDVMQVTAVNLCGVLCSCLRRHLAFGLRGHIHMVLHASSP